MGSAAMTEVCDGTELGLKTSGSRAGLSQDTLGYASDCLRGLGRLPVRVHTPAIEQALIAES